MKKLPILVAVTYLFSGVRASNDQMQPGAEPKAEHPQPEILVPNTSLAPETPKTSEETPKTEIVKIDQNIIDVDDPTGIIEPIESDPEWFKAQLSDLPCYKFAWDGIYDLSKL